MSNVTFQNQILMLQVFDRHLTDVFVQAAIELGFNKTDYNAISPLGVSPVQAVVKSAQRWDAGRAYIAPILKRCNLHVSTHSYVTKVLVNNLTASGVQFTRDGRVYEARVAKEVILSAGTIGSSHILLHSGIGPESHLKKVGVKMVHNLEVGSTFRDQPGMYGLYFTTNYTDPELEKGLNDKIQEYFNGTGLLGNSGSDALIFASLNQVPPFPNFSFNLITFHYFSPV